MLGKLPVDNLEHSSPNSPERRCQVGVQLKDLSRAMAKLEEMCSQIEKMTNFLVLNCMYASPLSAHPHRLRRGENVKSLGGREGARADVLPLDIHLVSPRSSVLYLSESMSF